MLREFSRLSRWIRRGLEQLDEDERLVLEMMVFVRKKGNLDKLCQELGVEKSAVYRRRDKALERLADILGSGPSGKSAGRFLRRWVVK